MRSSTVPSSKDQIPLFREAPTKIRYLKELPECGVCRKEKSAFHAPTKFGIWADMCNVCSETNTDVRFKLGFKLVQHTPTKKGGPLLQATDMVDITLVAAGVKPRIVVCEVCNTKREVKAEFSEVIICRSCCSRLKVDKLF